MALISLVRKTSRWLLLALVLTLAVSGSMQGSRTAEAGGGFILIFKTGPDAATPLQDSCFNIEDTAQSFLFEVCDNDFQGPPQSHPACVPDGVCEDEVGGTQGEIQVTVAFADDYWVVESKAPPGYVADPAKKMCPSICKILFVNQPESVGGVAELPDTDAAPLRANDSSDISTGLLTGIGASVAALIALAGAAAWYTRRRVTS